MPDIIASQDQRRKEQERIAALNRVVNFTNVDTEPFTHAFDSVSRTIPAGATVPVQWIIADLFATHLARKMLNRERRDKVKPTDRKRIYTDEEVETRKQNMIREIISVESRDIIPPAEQIVRREIQMAAAQITPPPAPRRREAMDKQMVVEELERRGVRVDRRKSLIDLTQKLKELDEQPVAV